MGKEGTDGLEASAKGGLLEGMEGEWNRLTEPCAG